MEVVQLKPKDLFLLVILAAIWGSSYLFIRIAAPVMGSIFSMGLRVFLAAAALLIYGLTARQMPDFKTYRWRFLLLGALNNAIPFVLIANSVSELNASIASTLNSTTPLFTAVVAVLWAGERFTARKVAGLVLGVIGVAVLMGWNSIPLSGRVILAGGEALLAALAYGLAAVYVRTQFKGVSPLHTSIGQLSGSTVLLAPLAAFNLPPAVPQIGPLAAVVVLALVCTVLAYLLYFRLITSAGATKATSVTFLIPLFSVLWGVLFLNEPLSAGLIGGLVVILVSVWLVLGDRAAERAPAALKPALPRQG